MHASKSHISKYFKKLLVATKYDGRWYKLRYSNAYVYGSGALGKTGYISVHKLEEFAEL